MSEGEKTPAASQSEAENNAVISNKNCCGWLQFHGCKEASGVNITGIGRGAVGMSNFFLSISFINLASEAAGCLDENNNVIGDCDNKVHGFTPPGLVSYIAVISGLLSAFLTPLMGALIDFTPHRRLVGILSAVLLVVIQGALVLTLSSTWFPMLILNAIAGFVLQVQFLVCYAYLPEIARSVGEKRMSSYTSTFTITNVTSQAVFLVLVAVFQVALGISDVQTAQISQGINVAWISVAFFFGYKLIPNVPACHEMQVGSSTIWTVGFKQVWDTFCSINQNYPHGLRWFLVAILFSYAAANSFYVTIVIFLDVQLQMNVTEIALFFLISLIASIPGAKVSSVVCKKSDPNTSWKIVMSIFSVVVVGAGFALTGPDVFYLAYVFGSFWGFLLGWFYSAESLLFSLILPQGRDAELTGFYIYCSQILSFLPPLVFTMLVDAGVSLNWSLMSIIIFFIIAVGFLCLMPQWEVVLKESAKKSMLSISTVQSLPLR